MHKYYKPFKRSPSAMDPWRFSNISTFLDNIGKADQVEEALSNSERFTEKDLNAINRYLEIVDFDQDRYGVWGRMLLTNQDMPMISELCLIHHLRKRHGKGNVDIHKQIDGNGSTNFDAVVQLNDTTVWIEITYEDLVKKLGEEYGAVDRKMSGYQIDDKIEKDFESAKDVAGEDDVMVMALYMEAGPMQAISAGYRMREGGKYDIPEFLDGFIQFEWIWDPEFEYIPFTKKGDTITGEIV